ncbi:MAG: hypothetical protein ACI8S6_000930 [Myxococcota bacterium]|jgi:uncharacterized protein YjbI with pentapeptide repeats
MRTGGEAWPVAWGCYVDKEITFCVPHGPTATAGRRADLHLRDLSQLVASDTILNEAHMIGITAEGCDFSGSDLSRAYITNALLARCRFDRANLTRTDFSRSDLRGADFRGARLRGTRFPGANLTGAVR